MMLSNKYQWDTYQYKARRSFSQQAEIKSNKEDKNSLLPDPEADQAEPSTFSIRHLKQGATGAVKTWPTADVLLEYLVQHGGLRDISDKIDNASTSSGILDLNCPPPLALAVENLFSSTYHPDDSSNQTSQEQVDQPTPYNIVELGGGTGYLSVALALALNNIQSKNDDSTTIRPRAQVRLMCTDNDRATIKNMRHNISRQPPCMNMNKTVKVESLDWGSDIGSEKFSNAVKLHFQQKSQTFNEALPSEESRDEDEEDSIRLLTHVIASDVLWGEMTLEPLSSIIAAMKLRNPSVAVILLLNERSPNDVLKLKHKIEVKYKCGLEKLMKVPGKGKVGTNELQDFSVSIRDVLHAKSPTMKKYKMVEC